MFPRPRISEYQELSSDLASPSVKDDPKNAPKRGHDWEWRFQVLLWYSTILRCCLVICRCWVSIDYALDHVWPGRMNPLRSMELKPSSGVATMEVPLTNQSRFIIEIGVRGRLVFAYCFYWNIRFKLFYYGWQIDLPENKLTNSRNGIYLLTASWQ